MKEHPILMNAAMVRATLDGSKTQTRRIWKLPKWAEWDLMEGGEKKGQLIPKDPKLRGWYSVDEVTCPFGQPGDRLWVRETWAFHNQAIGSVCDEDGPFVYAADPMSKQNRLCDKWTPSIHMPRWASRINLEITGVRVERLNNISISDCHNEGIGIPEFPDLRNPPVCQFRELWESINGPESWNSNPWVWVIEFKLVKS